MHTCLRYTRVTALLLFAWAGSASAATFSFQTGTSFDLSLLSPAYGVVGDFNDDHYPDIAVASSVANTGSILLNDGSGGLSSPHTFTVNGSLREFHSIAVADFNGDGKDDLIVTNSDNGSLSILLGHGDGTVSTASPLSTGRYNGCTPQPVVVAALDTNNDGKIDIVAASTFPISDGAPCYLNNDILQVFLGNGDGTFHTPSTTTLSSGGTSDIVVADFNGDSVPDVALAMVSSVYVLEGTGVGTYTPSTTLSTTGVLNSRLAVGDINADGRQDIVAINSVDASSVSVFLGNGDGNFTDTSSLYDVGYEAQSLALADLDDDGKPDLLVGNLADIPSDLSNIRINVLKGNGDGTFQIRQPVAVTTNEMTFEDAIPADMNNDGKEDVVAVGQLTGTLAGKAIVLLSGVQNSSSPSNSSSSSGSSSLSGGGGALAPAFVWVLALFLGYKRRGKRYAQ